MLRECASVLCQKNEVTPKSTNVDSRETMYPTCLVSFPGFLGRCYLLEMRGYTPKSSPETRRGDRHNTAEVGPLLEGKLVSSRTEDSERGQTVIFRDY